MFSLKCLVHKFSPFNTPDLWNRVSAVNRSWLLTASSLSRAHSCRTCFRFISVNNTYSSVGSTAVYLSGGGGARAPASVCMWRQEVRAKCLPQSLTEERLLTTWSLTCPVSQCWITAMHWHSWVCGKDLNSVLCWWRSTVPTEPSPQKRCYLLLM